MMKLKFFLILLCVFPILVFGQEEENEKPKEYPIDIELKECLSKEENFTTNGMLGCTDKAYKEWDKELNVVYQMLMSKLTSSEKVTLKKAQIEWIKFRDLEFKNIDSIYDKLQGTMYIPMRVNEKMQIVRTRVLQLDGYDQLLIF